MTRPPTRTVDQVDIYFGTEVPDPYRWLEDGDDPEVDAWLRRAGRRHTRAQLDALPGRDAITAALDRAVRPTAQRPARGTAARSGSARPTTAPAAGRPAGRATSRSGRPRVLIDPNTLPGDGSTSLAAWRPSPDGSLVAYSYSEAGSDWHTWRVRGRRHRRRPRRRASAGRSSPVRRGCRAVTASCTAASTRRGAMPTWPPTPGTGSTCTSSAASRSADRARARLPDEPDVTFWPEVTDDGRWLVVVGNRGTEPDRAGLGGRRSRSRRRRCGRSSPATTRRGSWSDPLGDELFMLTDRDAPRSRLVALGVVDGARPRADRRACRPARVRHASPAAGWSCSWLHDAAARLTVHDRRRARTATVALPGLGSVTETRGARRRPAAAPGVVDSFT